MFTITDEIFVWAKKEEGTKYISSIRVLQSSNCLLNFSTMGLAR